MKEKLQDLGFEIFCNDYLKSSAILSSLPKYKCFGKFDWSHGLTKKRQEVSRSDKKRHEVSRSVKRLFFLLF